MSLVITSSSKNEDDKTSSNGKGIENPSSYQNFLKSPLIIEPDTEVAVVSLKCSRDSDKVEVNEGDGIFVYWGAEDSQNMNDGTTGSEKPTQSDDINAPCRVELRKGVYTRKRFASHLQDRLEKVLKVAYREIDTITVSQVFDGSNVFIGFKIQIVQVGSGSAFTDKPSNSEFAPYIDKDTFYSIDDDSKFEEDDEVTDNFVASASGTDVLITGYKAGSTGGICDVIGKAHPLSQVKSQCVIYFNGSSASSLPAGPDGYTLGLVRSQGRRVGGEKRDYGAVGVYGDLLDFNNYSDDVNIPELYEDQGGDDTPPFFWDVAFNWAPGENGQVIQYINDNEEDDTVGLIDTVTLVTTPTNASLQAKYWEAVVFEVTGEKMDIKLKQTGKAVYDTLVSSASTTFGDRVKPFGMTCNQLYPKIAIHNNDSTNPGTAWLNTWNGHEALAYYENNYFGYTTDIFGDFPTSVFTDTAMNIDLSTIYGDGTISDEITDYTYKGELSGHKGIDNEWVFLTGDFEEQDLLYFNTSDQVESLKDDGRLQNILGFDAIMTQTDFGVSADSGADISFSSPNEPSFIPTTSMFVRIKNMAINTFNANKQSISNIIYSCPKFDAQGNTGGLLFYEPAERVYVKLNNVDKQVVNTLDVDIVDVNEKVIDSLVGNTLCVLHFRKAK